MPCPETRGPATGRGTVVCRKSTCSWVQNRRGKRAEPETTHAGAMTIGDWSGGNSQHSQRSAHLHLALGAAEGVNDVSFGLVDNYRCQQVSLCEAMASWLVPAMATALAAVKIAARRLSAITTVVRHDSASNTNKMTASDLPPPTGAQGSLRVWAHGWMDVCGPCT